MGRSISILQTRPRKIVITDSTLIRDQITWTDICVRKKLDLTVLGFSVITRDIFDYFFNNKCYIMRLFLSVLSRGHIFVFIRKPSKGRKGFFSVQICQNTPILAFSAN